MVLAGCPSGSHFVGTGHEARILVLAFRSIETGTCWGVGKEEIRMPTIPHAGEMTATCLAQRVDAIVGSLNRAAAWA